MAELKISVLHKLFSFFVAIGVALSAAAPFAIIVKADNELEEGQTYLQMEANNYYYFQRKYRLNNNILTYNIYLAVDTSNCRSVILHNPNGNYYLYIVSDQEFHFYNSSQNNGNINGIPNGSVVVDNTTYVYYSNLYSGGNEFVDNPMPIIDTSENITGELAVSYTFGDNAVGPTPPEPEVELLGLKNLRYSTRLVGHGTQGYQNIDEITWDPGRDLGENFLVGGTVQIRAVSGKYAALTYDGLKALSIGDFEIFGNPVVLADDIVATVGSFSVTWQTVFNSLTILSANLKAYQDAAGYWNREGWAYQYRYKLDNSTTTTDYSDWFTVYSFTSASGDSTVGLDNNLVAQPGSDGLYNNVVDSFNDINTINADIANNYNTNNYYYIDNNQYLINPDTTQQNTDQQSTWDQFTYKFHEYHDSEDLLINDMNNAIENLTPSADLNSNNNFLNAANWVKVQFNRMTLNTPMELIIIFSLTLGFGLLLIGRFK